MSVRKPRPKLVKNTKRIQFPRASMSVDDTLFRAVHYARKEGWDKIIIIGEGRDKARIVSNICDIYTQIGLLQTEIAHCTKDILDS